MSKLAPDVAAEVQQHAVDSAIDTSEEDENTSPQVAKVVSLEKLDKHSPCHGNKIIGRVCGKDSQPKMQELGNHLQLQSISKKGRFLL